MAMVVKKKTTFPLLVMFRHAGGNLESFMPTDEPIDNGSQHDSTENWGRVVHVLSSNGDGRREWKEDDNEDAECQSQNVDGNAPDTESEGAVGRVLTCELAVKDKR